MPIPTDVRRETKLHSKRRGKRMNSRVPVIIQWQPSAGPPACEDAVTRVLGPFGCLLVLCKPLDLDQRIELTNRNTRQTCAAVVVWLGKERVEGCEYGVELLDPVADFWEIEL